MVEDQIRASALTFETREMVEWKRMPAWKRLFRRKPPDRPLVYARIVKNPGDREREFTAEIQFAERVESETGMVLVENAGVEFLEAEPVRDD